MIERAERRASGVGSGRGTIRWWPAAVIAGATLAVFIGVRLIPELPFQTRNTVGLSVLLTGLFALWLWWLVASRAPRAWRAWGAGGVLVAVLVIASLFRIRGVSGDLIPILEPRWQRAAPAGPPTSDSREEPVRTAEVPTPRPGTGPDFPQFFGPDRTGVLEGPRLARDWAANPPAVLWRQPVGPAWSGFAIVGDRAVTLEQRGEFELVTAWEIATGRRLWERADRARYATTIAGEGPRSTPTVVGDRVVTLGATGLVNCLDLGTGELQWQRSLTAEAGVAVPEWGFAGSPLVVGQQVVVSAGGKPDLSLLAFDLETGERVWSAGDAAAGYSSPFLTELGGVPQILIFNSRRVTAHDPADGRVLWEHPWGQGHPVVALPVRATENRVVFSSGYGVGAELLEVRRGEGGKLETVSLWHSRALKAKFANFFAWDGHLYGLDDGILACVDLADGSRRWKEGRYGHGQMLRVDDQVLLLSERGDLVLLSPDPTGANELDRFPVFNTKTWNPPAWSGDLLLVRNDREAVALRLPLATTQIPAF